MPFQLNLFRQIVDHAHDAVMVTEVAPLQPPGPIIVYVNPAMCRMSGYDASELLGRSPRVLQGPLTDPAALLQLSAALRDGRQTTVELLNYHRSGTPYWARLHLLPLFDESGELSHFAALQQDTTARHIRSEALYRIVVSDEASSLFNRQMFFDVGAKCMRLALRQGKPLAAVLLEADDLCRLNKSYGQLVGQMLMRIVAQSIAAAIRESDVAGRLSPQEFGLLLPETGEAEAQVVLARIRERLSAGLIEAGLPDGAYLELRAGLCLAGVGDRTPEQALERARGNLRGEDQRSDAGG
ncbi:sensor domain-containing diguanylate cyclase [Chromobacterium piscinae]|uniref:sensor domain-containing diguanylate cyclase n=1 Tax=Chromobacterium piscinae TaxID=686831 RepID=UPI003207ED87